MRSFVFVTLAIALLGAVAPAAAQTKLSGVFIAKQACAAVQSIKKQTNPGDITLTPGTRYKLLGANKDPATYYWIVVPDAQPDSRWVPTSCGLATTDEAASTTAPLAPTSTATTAPAAAPVTGKAEYVLAISWEPAFCEGKPGTAECRAQQPSSYEATHFSLHGLWPQPRNVAYCNVSPADRDADKSHDWGSLPAVDLSTTARSGLERVMPGTQSKLERHEWIEHGSCSGASQVTYFGRATLFTDIINNSAVAQLFANDIGKRIDGTTIRQAFDTAFGHGAGDRIRIACADNAGRRLITEITVGLRGDVMGAGGLGELIAAAAPTDPGCNGGIVDRVGRD